MNTAHIQAELSEREIEIIMLLADGLTNQDIANRTGLTLYTVKWYLKQIYSKIHVNNRTQAATKAREMGLLESTPPEVAAIRQTRTLPKSITPFFGRENELEQIEHFLLEEDARLITIYGLGGMGKTRLAVEVAQRFSDHFPDGLFFVPLAQFQSSPLLAIANTLRLPVDSEGNVLHELSVYLYDKRCLIVLDNFEHLIDHATQITALLQQTHQLHFIVTSREALNLQAEVIFPLTGLEIADSQAALENNGAYQLYVQRARSVHASFEPDKTEQAVIGDICKLVGGMPLAIELAASWASVLSVAETKARLSASLDLLTTGEHDRPERQQSVRATFDYSVGLLPDDTRRVLISLGIFHAEGFTFTGAETVTGASLAHIKQLSTTALLHHHPDGQFTFHPLIRQYIVELLKADTALYQQVSHAHGQYYLDFVMSLIEELREEMTLHVVERFIPQMNNLDKAWFYAMEQGYFDWLEGAAEIGYICEMAGLWQEADQLFKETLEFIPQELTLLRGRLLAFRTIFAFRANDIEAMRDYGEQSWTILKDTRYAWDGGIAMGFLAVGECFLGNSQRGFKILDTVDPLLERDDLRPNGFITTVYGMARPAALFFAGQIEEALPLLETMSGPQWYESRIHLPECYLELGMVEKARHVLEDLYDAALDYGNYRLSIASTFYLTVIDSPPETRLDDLTRNFIELTRMGVHYLSIAQISFYFASQLIQRRHPRWAKLLFCGNLHVLSRLGTAWSMYKYTLKTAEILTQLQLTGGIDILHGLVEDADCPPEIQKRAARQLRQSQVQAKHSDRKARPLLDIVTDALLSDTL